MNNAAANGMDGTINARAHAPGEIDTAMKRGNEAEAID